MYYQHFARMDAMDNEKLIDLVRSQPVLYDHTHRKYSDNFYKEKLWKEIGAQLNQSSIACKARWNNIRDNYRKSKRKQLTTPTDGGNQPSRTYKYSEMLKFLDDYFHDRRSVAKKGKGSKNTSVAADYGDDASPDEQDTTDSADVYPEPLDNVFMADPQVMICAEDEEDVDGVGGVGVEEYDNAQSRKRVANTTICNVSATGIKRRNKQSSIVPYDMDDMSNSTTNLEYLETVQDRAVLQDRAVDAFLAGIAPTLKSLNPYHLNLAKSKIFNIVQHYEMEMIMEQSQMPMLKPKPPDNDTIDHPIH